MSSNASSSGIESDTDSSPSLQEEKDQQSISDIHNTNDDSIDTLMNDYDDEGFPESKEPSIIFEKTTPSPTNLLPQKPIQSTTSKSSQSKLSCYCPYSTRNPYDDDKLPSIGSTQTVFDDPRPSSAGTTSSTIIENWDEECEVTEPYYFPSYIRRAQWPNHWRWTPPLGIRRTCTQQLHRNFGFEPSGLYDDADSSSVKMNCRQFRFDF